MSDNAAATGWNRDASQADYLNADMVIMTTPDDVPCGVRSKLESHLWSDISNGALHRAFSILLFNQQGDKILLHQRALSKPTFPGMWTNACCSHPLANIPEEADEEDHRGVRRAAIRKLEQELGIPPSLLSIDDMVFLTRVHYGARDRKNPTYGEHEIDHVFILRKDLPLQPNPDEIAAVRWVTRDELAALCESSDSEMVSPWFIKIAKDFLLPQWWTAMLNGTLSAHVDEAIHRYPLQP